MSAQVDELKPFRVAEAYCYDAGAPNAAKNLRAAVAALIAERDALRARLERPALEDEEQRALEFLAAEYERDGKAGAADHIRTQPLLPNKARAVRAIAAALRQQPAPVVDDTRMARALEWVRVMAMQDADGSHVPAIEEAIAAYDPNCGARTVRVVDDGMRELTEAVDYVARYILNFSALAYSPTACKEAADRLTDALARAQGVQS